MSDLQPVTFRKLPYNFWHQTLDFMITLPFEVWMMYLLEEN